MTDSNAISFALTFALLHNLGNIFEYIKVHWSNEQPHWRYMTFRCTMDTTHFLRKVLLSNSLEGKSFSRKIPLSTPQTSNIQKVLWWGSFVFLVRCVISLYLSYENCNLGIWTDTLRNLTGKVVLSSKYHLNLEIDTWFPRFQTVYNMFNRGSIIFGSVVSLLVLGLHEYFVRFGKGNSEPPLMILVYYFVFLLVVINNFIKCHALRWGQKSKCPLCWLYKFKTLESSLSRG